MRKRFYFIFALFFLAAVAVYFWLYRKNDTLGSIPKDADAVLVIDVKKLQRKYLAALLTHPEVWKAKKSETHFLLHPSVERPDFLQIFHLKDTPVSHWFLELELNDEKAFKENLEKNHFKAEKDYYRNDRFFVRFKNKKAFVGTSPEELAHLAGNKNFRISNASDFITNGDAGMWFFNGNFKTDIFLHNDRITVGSENGETTEAKLLDELKAQKLFLTASADEKTLQNIESLFGKSFSGQAPVSQFTMQADLAEVSDTIVTYGYDDNFNETQKTAVQKIVQPNYRMTFESKNPAELFNYAKLNGWITKENAFTKIPFQPNLVTLYKDRLEVNSVPPLQKLAWKKGNFIYIKNSPLLGRLLKILPAQEKKLLAKTDYFFAAGSGKTFFAEIRFKNHPLPLIYR